MPRDPESTPPSRPWSLFERHYRLLEEILGRPFLGVWLRNLKAQGQRLISERE